MKDDLPTGSTPSDSEVLSSLEGVQTNDPIQKLVDLTGKTREVVERVVVRSLDKGFEFPFLQKFLQKTLGGAPGTEPDSFSDSSRKPTFSSKIHTLYSQISRSREALQSLGFTLEDQNEVRH